VSPINLANAAWQVTSSEVGPDHGPAGFVWNLVSGQVGNVLTPSAPTQVNVNLCVGADGYLYIDPSGTVRTKTGIPLVGAAVTLERAVRIGGRLLKVRSGSAVMSPGNRLDPSRTNVLGFYGWDTLPGQYVITVRHKGCTVPGHGHARTGKTRRLNVPPARTGVNFTLSCPSLRRARVRIKLSVQIAKLSNGTDRATVTLRGHRGTAAGAVTFTLHGRTMAVAPVIHGRVVTGIAARLVKPGTLIARYGGDGHYRPASARAHI
jgi:hypothetical protein